MTNSASPIAPAKSVRTSPASRAAPGKPAWPRSPRCRSRPHNSGSFVADGFLRCCL
jgi:hypothetical protein